MKLLLATHNKGKKAEYAAILGDLGYELVTLSDVGITSEVEETSGSFVGNALQKAHGYAQMAGMITLADDSGLEVDALDGAPGVLSARYGGPNASDSDRYVKLLGEMKSVPDTQRTARFRCAIAIVWPDGTEKTVEGACEGTIAHEPQGDNGFGYDPVFYVPEFATTMAMLPSETKNAISHRARAATAARELLRSTTT